MRLTRCLIGAIVLVSGCLNVRTVEEHRVASVGVGPNGVTAQEEGRAQEKTWRGPCFVRPDGVGP